MMRENSVKKKIKNGEYVIGTFVKMNDPSSVEILGLAGFDFFVLDNEHIAMNRESMVNMIRAAGSVNIVPIVRVRENNQVEILQVLDAGALGVQVPNVNTKEEAQYLIDSVKFDPIGKRGFSPTTRAASYGMNPIKKFVEESNANTLVVAHCETVTCMENLDEILKLENLDIIFIGPMDLSQSLGVIGEVNHPKVLESIDMIIKKVLAAGKAVGIVASAAQAEEFIEKGVQYLLISTDQGMIAGAAKQIIQQTKG